MPEVWTYSHRHRADGVDTNALLGVFQGRTLCQTGSAMLGGNAGRGIANPTGSSMDAMLKIAPPLYSIRDIWYPMQHNTLLRLILATLCQPSMP